MKFYLQPWHNSKFESKTKVLLQDNSSILRYVRCYEGREATFYTENSILFRDMYIYLGDFLEKTVLSYIEIKHKCSNSSIKSAFEECPVLYENLENFINDKDSRIVLLKTLEGEYYCLKGCYCTLFCSKKREYKNLVKKAEVFRTEISLIRTDRLKPSFMQKAKNFFKKSSKYALKFVVRAGIIVAASAIGASLDLPDFDFDIDTPDFEPDFDFDPGYDIGYDVSDSGLSELPYDPSGYNVSFGAQQATLERSGGGLGSLPVTITKEPGSSNLFCITDGSTTIHNVKGGTNSIKIDGIKYLLPKLKG